MESALNQANFQLDSLRRTSFSQADWLELCNREHAVESALQRAKKNIYRQKNAVSALKRDKVFSIENTNS